MKGFLLRLLAAIGLAPASVVASQARLAAELRASSLAWKKKTGDALARVQSLEARISRQAHAYEKLRTSSDKLRHRQDKIEKLLRRRVVDANTNLAAAREQLMAINAKLDILEGAANVLEARTRSATSERDEPVAPA